MNPFQKHGIDHLSPSSLNLWRASPGLWSARYLAHIDDEVGPGAWRGKAVETGLRHFWLGQSIKDSCGAALEAFEAQALGLCDEETEAERSLVPAMLERAARWPANDELAATQVRVEHWFPGVPVPVIGFIDFAFIERDFDLKTTRACPSKPRGNDVRQVALYGAARGKPQGILYVTDKRFAAYQIEPDDLAMALAEMEQAALILMAALDIVRDAKHALSIFPIDYDDFRAGPMLRAGVTNLLLAA